MLKLETKPLKECQVLIVDDELVSQEVISSALDKMVQCAVVGSGEEAIAFCQHTQPDLIILDLDMPGRDGLSVCMELKRHENTQSTPVIFVTATLDVETENNCWRVGAADYVLKPVTMTTLRARVKTHIQNKLRMELLENLTLYDPLTGVYNRLYLRYELPSIIRQLLREQQCLSMVLVDIDFFKAFNDTYGHLEGDACLKQVAEALNHSVHRPRDVVIRFGGEEFLILLSDTDLNGASQRAQKMVDNVRELNKENKKGIKGKLTLSAGVECCDVEELRNNKIIEALGRLDKKLYKAKEEGRSRVWKMALSE
ncbi:diguanylate cyclase [Alteromonas halophila]|uniref:diguanylate cyclase n=1 Tax=Alteromonas halophila TaxID=516698 RepID=A0A918JE45_9ALTE|nr:diguanylate cyclase [Alteromonas halophila]GGW76291.1 diguanylate cyclase response regulator [Alteromonas halophila]